jgi:ABC-type Fe3+-hydroxamate transport system substrate-binding protein
MLARDDMGTTVEPTHPAARVVSLVPSLTESLAATRREALAGATDWCTRPTDLDVPRVRGTKNPDVAAIADLRPDLVLANKEENRELDVRRLRQAGVQVWVTVVESVPSAVRSLSRVFEDALGWGVPDWLHRVAGAWAGPVPSPTTRVAVAVWRDPWMVIGRDTFAGDLLARLGYANVFAGSSDRYPHVSLEEVDRDDVDLVLLPDEPYVFTRDDGPEEFSKVRPVLVSGRLLTWYGPSLLEAREALSDLAPD